MKIHSSEENKSIKRSLSRRAIAVHSHGLRGHNRHENCTWRVLKTSKVTGTRSQEMLGHEEKGEQKEETSLIVAGQDLPWLWQGTRCLSFCLLLVTAHLWDVYLSSSVSIDLRTALCSLLHNKSVTEHLWNSDSHCLQTLSTELLACINLFVPVPFLNKKQALNHSHPNVTELLLV